MSFVPCVSSTAAWTEQIYKLRWFHTCVSRELSFDKAFTACSISASGVYLLHLSGIFLLFAKANDGFLNPQNQVTVALVTLLFSRTAAWTEQFHKLRWVQTCVAHSLPIDQAITACSIPTTCVYLLPLQGLIVLFLTSQMKASLINENCGVVEEEKIFHGGATHGNWYSFFVL